MELQQTMNGGIQQHCLRSKLITEEMWKFMSKSFLKTSAIICTMICLLCLKMIKDLLQNEDENRSMLIFSTGVVLSLNCLLIFMVEKKGFTEIVRLKTNSIRM